jgi:hypothetical protein
MCALNSTSASLAGPDVEARMQRESTGIGRTSTITLLHRLFCSGRHSLQREQLLAARGPLGRLVECSNVESLESEAKDL